MTMSATRDKFVRMEVAQGPLELVRRVLIVAALKSVRMALASQALLQVAAQEY